MSRIPPPIPFRRFRPGRALALCLGLAWAASLAGAAFLKTWVPQRFLEADEVLVRCAASPEGRMLAIQQQSGAIRLVDLDRRETVKVVPRLADGIACLALGPEGEVLVAGAGRDVYALDLAGGGPPRRLWHGGSAATRVAVIPPRNLAAVASADGLRVLNLASGDTVFANTENPCLSLAFSPDGQTLAATQGKVVSLYDLPNVILRWRLPVNFFPASIAFAQDSSELAVAGDAGLVVLAGTADGQVRRKVELGLAAGRIQELAITPDLQGLVAASGPKVWVVDDLSTGRPRREIKLDDRITGLVLSARAQSLIAATRDARYLTLFATSMPLPANLFVDFKPKPQIRIRQPEVEILSPATETQVQGESIQLLARVRAGADQKLQSLRVLVDGRQVSAPGGPLARDTPLPGGAPPLAEDEELYRFTVPLPGQDCTVAMLGETLYATSRLAVLKLRRPAPAPAARPAFSIVQPQVAILSPQPETLVQGDAVQLTLKVRSAPGQKYQGVRMLVDGRAVEAVGGLRPRADAAAVGVPGLRDDEDLLAYSVPLPDRDCTVAVMAETAFADSAPATVRLRRAPPPPVPPPPPVITILRPTVEILSPASEEIARLDAVDLLVRIAAAPEQPLTSLKVQVDGQSVAVLGDQAGPGAVPAGTRPAAPDPPPGPSPAPAALRAELRRLRVPIPGRNCTVTVWAETRYATSDIAALRVRREDKPLPPPPAARPEPPVIVPPTVQLLSPQDGVVARDDSLELKIRLGYSAAQGLTGVRFLVDGAVVPASALRGLRPRQDPGPWWKSSGRCASRSRPRTAPWR